MFTDNADKERIEFLLTRDSAIEVLLFAKQCVTVYRGAVLSANRKFSKHNVYREAYIRSYLFHKRYVNNQMETLWKSLN